MLKSKKNSPERNTMDKIALDALMKKYRKGLISDKTLKRAIKAGVVRPRERYIEGIEKGTRNIINQINQRNAQLFKEFNTPPIRIKELANLKDRLQGGGFLSDVRTNTIGVSNPNKISHRFTSPVLSSFGRKTRARGEAAIGARHEAYEMLEAYSPKKAPMAIAAGKYQQAKKLTKKEFKIKDPKAKKILKEKIKEIENMGDKAVSRATINPYDYKTGVMMKEVRPPRTKLGLQLKSYNTGGILLNNKFFVPVSNHMHPNVIAREADLISKIPYKDMTKKLSNIRLETGERQYLTYALGQDPYERGLPPHWYKKLDRTISPEKIRHYGGRGVLITKEIIDKYPQSQNRFTKALSNLKSFFGKLKR